MVNIPFHASRLRGNCNRRLYLRLLPWMVSRPARQTEKLPAQVYSLSCERDLPEQAACIFSFLRHVGTPDSFVVISDGSYSPQSRRLLQQISPCVSVADVQDIVGKNLPQCVQDYAQVSPMGKKLAVELSLPVERARATIYTDSDVLFFPGASELAELICAADGRSWYLPDLPGCLDERLLETDEEKQNPVNGGFMLLKRPLDWDLALARLARLSGSFDYFTEQTLLHLTMHQSEASSLRADKFILGIKDQYRYSDTYAGKKIALRHYVSTVRHKFWHSKVWR